MSNNRTGLPDALKTAVESLAQASQNSVGAPVNVSLPPQLNAHAYAQGRDIHVAPGQERHLPSEAWEITQQQTGRVTPTGPTPTPTGDDAELNDLLNASSGLAPVNVQPVVQPDGGRSGDQDGDQDDETSGPDDDAVVEEDG